MDFDRLSKSLTLIANIGVLIGIIIVIFELRQTQTAMLAESSSTRAQLMSENISISLRNGFTAATIKVQAGEQPTAEELLGVNEFIERMLRHMENVHYQHQLGVIDEEIWNSVQRGIARLRNSPLFEVALPDWPNGGTASIHRASFVELVESIKEQ